MTVRRAARGTPVPRKRVLVTGASRGIGRVVCRRLARDGMDLVLVARDGAALEGVREELTAGDHVCCALDVRCEEDWREARSAIAPRGRLDGIVTAAAVLPPVGPVGTWDAAAFRSSLDVNVMGTLLPILTSLDFMRDRGGSVVTFSGGGATRPMPRYDAYAASKAAVVRLTENLASELAGAGIRFNSVAPGFVATEMHEATLSAGPGLSGAAYFEKTRQIVASGTGDSPERAASLVAFLLSEEAEGISGRLLSARWDPWEETGFRERLRADPDLATLRRIDDQFFGRLTADAGDRRATPWGADGPTTEGVGAG